jgi:aminoglycoside phosphotransferase (APT) family kinase protein
LHTREQTDEYVALDQRETLAHSFVDTLADLHALDPDDIGLGNLGKKEGYVDRQVKTWYRSWQASIEPAGFDDPRAHELQAYFLRNRPEQGKASVVHGDFGFHNCLIGPDARVAAVIDWEISTLGDPLADLAYTLKTWPQTAADIEKIPEAATSAEGFPVRALLAERYARRTGLDISSLDFYIGFNLWKMAAILHGVYARYMAGQKSTEGVNLKFLLSQIELSMAEAAKAIEKFDANKG